MGIRDDERRKTTQAHAAQPPLRAPVGQPNHAIRETLWAPPHPTQFIRPQQGGPLHHHLILLTKPFPSPDPATLAGTRENHPPEDSDGRGTTSVMMERLDKARVASPPEHGRHANRSRERESLRPRRENSTRRPTSPERDRRASRSREREPQSPSRDRPGHTAGDLSMTRRFVREYGPVRDPRTMPAQTGRSGPPGPTQPPVTLPPNIIDPQHHFQRTGEDRMAPTPQQHYHFLCQLLRIPPMAANPASPWY